AWDRYKDLLRTCPHHGFTELNQLDTFYNALNPTDQDSLNSVAGGNLLEKRTQDVLTIIENKSKIAKLTHAVNQQTTAVTTAMTAILKQFQATPPSVSLKAVEEICVTCGGAHLYYQCLAAGGNTFSELRNNIQGYVAAAAVNYNQGNSVYRLPGSKSLLSNTIANLKGELKAITTRSGIVLDGPSVPIPPTFINPEEDERVEETLTDQYLAEYTIKPSGNPTFSSHPELTSPEVKDNIFNPEGGNFLPEKLLDLDSTKDLHPPLHVNPLSGSTTYSSSPNKLLKEFADELALITFPSGNDDLQFYIESDLKGIKYLLHHDPIKDLDSILKDSINQSNLADLNDNFVDSMPEMFTNEHALDYSSPSLYDEYDDDLFEVESDTENAYDDPFDSKGEKIKESKLLIDELDLLCDFLLPSEYDSFISDIFSRLMLCPQPTTRT
nr:reverse transcriptase domain-containing protein [Tanacetum cinerariifolium]